MIVYEPPADFSLPRASRVRKRALAAFVAAAQSAIPLPGAVSILLTGDAQMCALNRRFRKKNKPTDVLSFPAVEGTGGLAGDLAISLETALRQAQEMGHSLESELKILLLHGLLHLAGYDHEADQGEMRRLEARLRRKFGLPHSLTERSAMPHAGPTGRQRPAPGTGARLLARPARASRPAAAPGAEQP
jgi:probable rRNA maturation factor